ncbi:MAG: ABC transporter permease [Verrucomicrobiae bacterium]|nr:ABC transporter permease [Verrucomicrobiae bacterium]
MRNVWILFKREMLAYFCSPIAYIVGVCVLGLTGISFNMIVTILSESPSDFTPLMWFFNGMFTWIILLVVPPVITMRLFADEKRAGTIETLMTAPLRDIEYVAAKFLSGLVFYSLLWLPTLSYVWVLRHFSQDKTPLDLGPVVGGYLGLFLMGMLLVALGCVASASTRNQIIAAVLAFAMGCALFFTGIYFYLNAAGQNREFFESFSMLAHMQDFSRGVIEWKRPVFYLTFTGFLLFVTHRIVQARQWKT